MEDIPLVIHLKKASVGQEGVSILSAIDFELGQAEMCYLVGKSGAGKSTLLKTLYGSIPLLSGEGSVAGFDLNDLDKKSIPLLRRKVGMVFQDFHLFDKWTVYNNLDYVLKAIEWKNASERDSRIGEVLHQIGLSNYRDTPIFRLSGGEQQKVVIARAVLNRPQIIIADEPTGNLDPESSDEIMRLLYEVATENKTAILIATHDNILMEKFPARTYECTEGRIKEH